MVKWFFWIKQHIVDENNDSAAAADDIFQKINMKGTFPRAVIIDDFAEFFDDTNCKKRYGGNYRGLDLAMVCTLALCRPRKQDFQHLIYDIVVSSGDQHIQAIAMSHIYINIIKQWKTTARIVISKRRPE
ncbi:hypothetical protein MKW98_027303 [Papaver atlanticum]|uniref:Uncharacterized protein n=1 Tax=Papaver atlanticum TaxID=357466 RepID=A0AAD4SR08_9MAGN|nr:hypothetical protein MKW98_027303 [Papaver atlanticum]